MVRIWVVPTKNLIRVTARSAGYGRQVHGAKTRDVFADLRSFLRNHAQGIAAIEMFVVASVSFRLLYVMI